MMARLKSQHPKKCPTLSETPAKITTIFPDVQDVRIIDSETFEGEKRK